VSISLFIESIDPEVERLLAHLETESTLDIREKLLLIKRAQKWLEAAYELTPDPLDSVHVHLSLSQLASQPLHKPAPHPSVEPVSRAIRTKS